MLFRLLCLVLLLVPAGNLYSQWPFGGGGDASVYPERLYGGMNVITITDPNGIARIQRSANGRWVDMQAGQNTAYFRIVQAPTVAHCPKKASFSLFVKGVSKTFSVQLRITDCSNNTSDLNVSFNDQWNVYREYFPTMKPGQTNCHTFTVDAKGLNVIIDSIGSPSRQFVIKYTSRRPPLRVSGGASYRYDVCYTAVRPGFYKMPILVYVRRDQPAGGYTNFIVADTAYVTVADPNSVSVLGFNVPKKLPVKPSTPPKPITAIPKPPPTRPTVKPKPKPTIAARPKPKPTPTIAARPKPKPKPTITARPKPKPKPTIAARPKPKPPITEVVVRPKPKPKPKPIVVADTSVPLLHISTTDVREPADAIEPVQQDTALTGPQSVPVAMEEPLTDPTPFRVVLMPNARPVDEGKFFAANYDLAGWVAGYGITDRLSVLAGAMYVPKTSFSNQLLTASLGAKYEIYEVDAFRAAIGAQFARSQSIYSDINLAAPYLTLSLGDDDTRASILMGYSWRHHAVKDTIRQFNQEAVLLGIGADYRIGYNWKIAAEGYVLGGSDYQPLGVTLRYFTRRLAIDGGVAAIHTPEGFQFGPVFSMMVVW